MLDKQRQQLINTLKNFSWRSFAMKVFGYLFVTYLLLVTVSVIVTGVIFFNLDSLKHRIIEKVDAASGGHLTISSLQTKLNKFYMPELVIDGLRYSHSESSSQEIYVRHIDVAIDYSTLWKFQPIFNEINVDGAQLNFVIESNGALYLNGIQLTDADEEKLQDVKAFDFDIEKFILNQRNIDLDHIGISFEDKVRFVPRMTLDDINLSMNNGYFSHHNVELNVFGKLRQNRVQTKLDWDGGKFEKINKWSKANLVVYTDFNESNLQNPELQSLITADLKDGLIQNIHADFDANNFKLALNGVSAINLPDLDGKFDVELHDNKEYTIKGSHLRVSTTSGYLFKDSEISGNYLLNKHGYIKVTNADLIALNNFLSLFPNTEKLWLEGLINDIQYTWNGKFTAPSEYDVSSHFNNVSLVSNESSIPSLNNISGAVKFNTKHGEVELNLANSTLLYSDLFLIPYEFNNAHTKLNWQVSESGLVKVQLESTVINTKDFSAVAQGKFIYDPNNAESPSYIDMTAHVDKVLTSKVGDYLPTSIPMSVHEWLNMALVGGYGESADLVLYGPLGSFPFADNSGLFYITANVQDASLIYAKGWEELKHINGKFILKNTNITVLGDSVNIHGNHGEKVKVVIPDYSSESGVYLTANAEAHGTTKYFMEYLVNTPVNHIIGKLPERIKSAGNGDLTLYLNVPFNDPHATVVNGYYDFHDNDLDLGIPSVPKLSNVNGALNFTQYGVNIKDITANALGATAHLSAETRESDPKHEMKFTASIPDLDYKDVAYEYLPFLAPIIEGKEDTKIKFTIGKGGLKELVATSDLRNVSINAPEPLVLQKDEPRELYLKITPETNEPHSPVAIDWRYGDHLKGVQYAGEGLNSYGKIAAGQTGYMENPDQNSIMTIQGSIESFNIEQWIATIGKLVGDNKEREHFMKSHEADARHASKNVFPIQVQIVSDHIMLGKQDFGNGTVNVLVTKKNTSFNLYTPVTSGYGNFDYNKKAVNLTLDKYMLYKKLPVKINQNIGYVPLNFVNGGSNAFKVKLPDINLKINNLFLQNHNLGSVSTRVHQNGDNLYLESGVLTNKDYTAKFSGVNYCFGCVGTDSYVNLVADADVTNLGNLIYNLDFGRLVGDGRGQVKASLQWNGGFQDFKVYGIAGRLQGNFYDGNILNINTGTAGAVMKFLDLQGLFQMALDPNDLFNNGIFFTKMNVDVSLLTTRLDINQFDMYGPLADVKANGITNLEGGELDVNLSVMPHLGFAIAVAAGIATLNPIVGLAVYGVELLTGGLQNKLVTATYDITGTLGNPVVKKTNINENIVHNVNSSFDLDYGL